VLYRLFGSTSQIELRIQLRERKPTASFNAVFAAVPGKPMWNV